MISTSSILARNSVNGFSNFVKSLCKIITTIDHIIITVVDRKVIVEGIDKITVKTDLKEIVEEIEEMVVKIDLKAIEEMMVQIDQEIMIEATKMKMNLNQN